MARRLLDVLLAALALIALAPLCVLAAAGVRLSGPGPIIFRAPRMGRGGHEFTMYKFRSMRVGSDVRGSVVTAHQDPRVFPFGALLRALKIDELPQLVNVLRGEMSIVGPRPEHPQVVREVYTPWQLRTLAVRPGLAGPGSLFNYTHGDRLIGTADPERDYRERVLDIKLALDLVYIQAASVRYDLVIIARTLWTLACHAAGRREFPEPREAPRARRLLVSLQQDTAGTPAAGRTSMPDRRSAASAIRSEPLGA
jgi:lipopolysaccharide/colanic/teichoic acid biosynthesis glycosyltransferase